MLTLLEKYTWPTVVWHILLGIIAWHFPIFMTAYAALVIGWGIVDIWQSTDAEHKAGKYALYLAGLEIAYRVADSMLFWQLGTIGCGILLLVGLVFHVRNLAFIPYVLLLLPGVWVALGNPICRPELIVPGIRVHLSSVLLLGLAGTYFYGREVSLIETKSILHTALVPSLTILAMLFSGEPVWAIHYVPGSNFDASGGFGPNQVSVALSWFGVLVGFSLVKGYSFLPHRWMDWTVFHLIMLRCILTVSRGGFYSAVLILLLLGVVIGLFESRDVVVKQMRVWVLLIAGLAINFMVANMISGNSVLKRVQGYERVFDSAGNEVLVPDHKGYFNYRVDLIQTEWRAFLEHPLWGVGMGRGRCYRGHLAEFGFSSHTEFSRLLGEHGLWGLAVLVFYFIFLPVRKVLGCNDSTHFQWFMVLFLFSVLTMSHNSTRLAIPVLAYAWAFVHISEKN